MNGLIPLSVPNFIGNEYSYIADVLQQGWVSSGGKSIEVFERKISDYVHVSDAAACQSGTAALHLSLICSGVKPGDEVIVPTLTYIASVNPIKYIGAEPVFMDCDDSLCMNMDKLEDFIVTNCEIRERNLFNKNSGRRISAVLVVHIFGNIADMEKLMDLQEKYGFFVIEDATEALGSYINVGRYKGLFAGTIGDMGIYSFNGNKIITTGSGGMIISKDHNRLEKARYLSLQAKNDQIRFIHEEIGFNYRMTNLHAALGLGQIEQLERFIQIKSENYSSYLQHGIDLLPFKDGIRPNCWFYSYLSNHRDEIISFLNDKNIQSRPIWYLNHKQKPYRNCETWKIEKAEYYQNRVVNLPCSSNLLPEEIDRVSVSIHQFYKQFGN
ncbi:MAG: LegC family aminotransferase [Flexilinea sp.]